MNDSELLELLKSLPTEPASLGFTTRVLSRLGDKLPVRRAFPLRAAVAGALAVALLAGGLAWKREATRREHRTARLQSLQLERERLANEVASLRQLAGQKPTVVYLGGDEETDWVLDLDRLARQVENQGYRPVANTGY